MLTSSEATLAKRFFTKLGYWPNLENPRTIQEKILWRKLYEDMSEAVRLADKVGVRDYVRDVVGEKYLIPALAIADSADDVDFDALPDSFVLKVNRTSGTNMVVQDKSQLDVEAIRRILNSLLRLEYGRRLGEHWYAAMPPKLLVERLLVDRETVVPIDYRFHVFHGKAEFVQVASQKQFSEDRLPGVTSVGQKYVDNSETLIANYDLDWQPTPFHLLTTREDLPVLEKPPGGADEMVAVAEKLAGDWGYVRVDLYCIEGRDVYFGEMTFANDSGLFTFVPDSYNEYFGSLWDIHRRYVRTERQSGTRRPSRLSHHENVE
jgi:hypothetical protein